MTDKIHTEQHDPPRDSASHPDGLSMMAVQELLGLFDEHQTHANRSTSDAGESTTDHHSALDDKPLTYI
jgi:hypothetical protein